MAIPSFSAFHDEGINLEGLLEILSPENNLVLADDMMVSDGNGIILRVSETYEKNFGFAHDSIVGKSAFDLEADGTFTPCITAEVIRRRKKISATQTINHTHKNVMTVGIPLFDANGELKYAVCFNTVSMEQIFPGDRGAADPGHLHQPAVQKRPHAAAVDADAEHCQHPGQHSHHRRDRRG